MTTPRGPWLTLPKILILIAVAAAGIAFIDSIFEEPGPTLPVLGKVVDFYLIERSGGALSLSDLLGKVWIADFIFTRCAGPCPLMTTRMSNLQDEIDPAVRLVSFSVDPEYDTPEVLSKYADQYGADRDRWAFLTGEQESIHRLARESLKLTVKPAEDPEPILHSLRFVLVDREGRIRGYYDSTRNEELEKLRMDAATLLEEG